MIARSIAASAMLMAIVGAAGGAYWQDPSSTGAAAIRTADVAETAPAAASASTTAEPASPDAESVADTGSTEKSTESETKASRTASAAERVVESAGFPVVPSDDSAAETVADRGPVVTVNGRPLGAPATEDESDPTTLAKSDEPSAADETKVENTEVAALPSAPVPVPRPQGLEGPGRSMQSTITASTSRSGSSVGFERRSSSPEREVGLVPQALDRLGARSEPAAPVSREPSPESEGLIEVIGENGESIWLYPEQVQSGDRAPDNAVDTDSYGIVYVD